MAGDRNSGGETKGTRTELVRQRLEAEILSGLLPPGTHLDEKAQATRLGCSRTPLREAFNQLVATGLLTRRNHCGVHVAIHDRRRICDLVQAYAVTEAFCADLAICRGGLAGLSVPGDGTDFRALLRAVRERCGNGVLTEMAARLEVRVEPYRRLEGALAEDRDGAAAMALAAAIRGNNGDEIVRIVRNRLLAMAETASACLPATIGVAA